MQFMDDAIWKQSCSRASSRPHEAYMKAIDKNRFRVFLPPEEAELANSAWRRRKAGGRAGAKITRHFSRANQNEFCHARLSPQCSHFATAV